MALTYLERSFPPRGFLASPYTPHGAARLSLKPHGDGSAKPQEESTDKESGGDIARIMHTEIEAAETDERDEDHYDSDKWCAMMQWL